MKKRAPRRSPLRDAPLRVPGQSIQEEIDDVLEQWVVRPIFYAAGFTVLAVAQWIQILTHSAANPWLLSIAALIAILYAVIYAVRAQKRLRELRMARDGERIVAEQLDVLKRDGAAVIHDVVADGFNIDHVVLSTKGVFVVETKTRSKPVHLSPTVTYDGKAVLVDGRVPTRDPLAQVEASTKWVVATLRSSTGKVYPVKGVILFPGWFVEPLPPNAKTWVVEPKALPSFIAHEPTRLTDEDLHLAVYHMSRIVRVSK